MAPRSAGLLMLLLAACATPRTVTVQGKKLSRVDLGYTDRTYFAFAHRGALPPEAYGVRRGLRDGGRISGVACGVDFVYDVWYRGRSVLLTGFVRGSFEYARYSMSSYLEVRDREGVREIRGSIGNIVGYSTVDLRLTRDSIQGRVSRRRFDLWAEGDAYLGGLQIYGRTGRFVALGREALWNMPPEDQAVVIPTLFACARGVGPYPGYPITMVSFAPFEQVVAPPSQPPSNAPGDWEAPSDTSR
ncbi:MAG TPA: hypothetical protein VH877_10570 [Polyangia bacterium]|jgi:hypothetical protein|nr:hypothetical protein [Polyangia bacterium]